MAIISSMNTSKKLIGNWQKDFYTTKAVRKMHILKGRMGIEVIELGPVPLGGNLEEKGDFLGGHLP